MTEKTETLQLYEQMFKHRFTAEDQEYQKYRERPAAPPPIVEDWKGRGAGNPRGRDQRYQDRRGHRGRGWGGGRGWRGDREQQHWQDRDQYRDRERHWDRDRDRDRDRGRDRERHWDRDRDQSRDQDRDRHRDRDRDQGHGSGSQSGPPGSYQGQSSHQRPQPDRY